MSITKGVKEGLAFRCKLHAFIALATMIAIGQYNILLLLGVLIGSYLPDADTRKSNIGKILPLWMMYGLKSNIHRKYFHSFYYCAVFGSIGILVDRYFGIGVLIGYFMHLWADSTTQVGLPYALYPYRYNKDHWYFTGKLPWKQKEAAD